ncbi:MAG: hypothetical protein ACXWWG_06605, partial [Nitrospira sp.]
MINELFSINSTLKNYTPYEKNTPIKAHSISQRQARKVKQCEAGSGNRQSPASSRRRKKRNLCMQLFRAL